MQGGGRKVESDRVSVAQALFSPEHFALHRHLAYPPRAPCSQPGRLSAKPMLCTGRTWQKRISSRVRLFLPYLHFTQAPYVLLASLPHSPLPARSRCVSIAIHLALPTEPGLITPAIDIIAWTLAATARVLPPCSAHIELYHTYARGASADRFL